MLRSCRRIVVAIIAIALTSQLVQGQMLLCGQMNMSGEAVADASMAAGHERHEVARERLTSEAGAQIAAPHSSKCMLAASCGNATAALMPSLSVFVPELVATDLPAPANNQRLRPSRPDLPPPRA